MINQKCERCSYHGRASIMGIICEYILCTGKRRPCPAGAKCTVFTTKPIPRDEEMWTSSLPLRKMPPPIFAKEPNHGAKIKRRRSVIDKEELIRLKLDGKSDYACAKIFGCSQSSVTIAKIALVKAGRLPESMYNPISKP